MGQYRFSGHGEEDSISVMCWRVNYEALAYLLQMSEDALSPLEGCVVRVKHLYDAESLQFQGAEPVWP